MLRPSYNEQINGFGFAKHELNASVVTLTESYDSIISVVTEVISEQGSMVFFTKASKVISIGNNDQGGVGVLIPMSADTRECYSYSMAGVLGHDTLQGFAFCATLEDTYAQDTIQEAKIRCILPSTQVQSNTNNATIHAQGFVRPNINPSGYADIDDVTGLVFGIGFINSTGGALGTEFVMSFEVQRWNNPDVNIRTPVV